MRSLTICILFLLLVSEFNFIHAQKLNIHAIEVYFPAYNGTDDLGDFDGFISKTKNPNYFQTDASGIVEDQLDITQTGFSIDFIFRNDGLPSNEYSLGFGYASSTSNMHHMLGTFQDTLDVNSTYEVISEYFYLHGAYRRVFRTDKKFSIHAGSSVRIGIPVSSKTVESIRSLTTSEDFEFFANQSISALLTIPIGFQLKLFRNVSSSLIIQNGLLYQNLDGTSKLSPISGSELRFIFRLRNQ